MNLIEQLIYNYIKSVKTSSGNLDGWINSELNISKICLTLGITESDLNIALHNLIANHYLIESEVCSTKGATTVMKHFSYKRFSIFI